MLSQGDRSAAIATVFARSGGYADRASLARAVGRRGVEQAVQLGTIRRVARGLYAPAHTPADAAQVAAAHHAVLCGLSAAHHLRWEVLREPVTVTAIVRHHRRVTPPKRLTLLRRPLRVDEIREGVVTTPLRTVLDCAATLPLDEAVAVADSALRRGDVEIDDVIAAARQMRGRHRPATLRVAALLDGAAENPFESALRVRCREVGLDVRTQVPIRVGSSTFRVDLADIGRRLVVEADSYAFHANPEAFTRDCVRYTELVSAGWTVLRMPYARVVDDPEWCRRVLGCVESPARRATSEAHWH